MSREYYDVYRAEVDRIPVNFEGGALTEIQGRTSEFSTCRYVREGKVGYYTASARPDDELVARAGEAAAYGNELDVDLPAPQDVPAVASYSETTAALGAAEMVEWGRQIIEGVREGVGKDLPVDVQLEREVIKSSISNSKGVAYEHRATSISVGASLMEAAEGDLHSVFDVEYSTDAENVEPDRMINCIVDYYRRGLETTSVPTAAMPVLLHPFAVPLFLVPLLAGLDGERVKDKTSPLIGKLGESIFHEAVTIADDPFLPGVPGGAPFDGEGVVARRRPLVEKGVLRSFNHTLETAKAAGEEATGGAHRGAAGKPAPGIFNLVMEAGDTPHEDILRSIDRGLFLRYMSGSGQGNNLAGEFQMAVYSGYLIEGGELTKRLKNVMVAGNVYDVFRRVEAVSSDRVPGWDDDYNVLAPYVLLGDVSVAGG